MGYLTSNQRQHSPLWPSDHLGRNNGGCPRQFVLTGSISVVFPEMKKYEYTSPKMPITEAADQSSKLNTSSRFSSAFLSFSQHYSNICIRKNGEGDLPGSEGSRPAEWKGQTAEGLQRFHQSPPLQVHSSICLSFTER